MLVTVITDDELGHAIAIELGRKFTVRKMSLTEGLEREWQEGECGLVAICTERPHISAFEGLGSRLRKANLPLTFACIVDSSLFIGPLIVPWKSPCFVCFRKRMLSNMGSSLPIAQERVVRAAFDRDGSLKSPGMLPMTPILAAARLAQHAALQPNDYGVVTHVSLARSRTLLFRVHRVHGCDCQRTLNDADKFQQSSELISLVEKLQQ